MKKITLIILILFVGFGNAQNNSNNSNDTITKTVDGKKWNFKPYIIPSILIIAGSSMVNSNLNTKIQNDVRHAVGEDFSFKMDDYIQYMPIAQVYAGNYLGFKSKNNYKQQTVNLIIANSIMCGVVSSIKKIANEERPDLSAKNSFPSGHTALAFTNAAILFEEYKDSNIWYASSGFVFATATGFLRIANNRHYSSDVLAGAGIGLATGIIVSKWSPFKEKLKSNKKSTTLFYPQIGGQMGIGMLHQF